MLPRDTKAIAWTNDGLSSVEVCGARDLKPSSQDVLQLLICETSLEDALVKLLPHRSGANELIKSRRYSGGFVPVRTPPPAADSCSHDNFWTTFWISFIFSRIVGPDL